MQQPKQANKNNNKVGLKAGDMERKTNVNNIINTIVMWALFFTFMILKLCNVIDWAWVWVTAPLWICTAFGVLMLIICGIIIAVQSVRYRKKFKMLEKRFWE